MKSLEKCLPRAACATIARVTVLVTICCAGSFAVAGTTTGTSAGGGKGAITGGVDASDTANGGLNVINIASLSNPKLASSGTAGDFFVIKVAGSASTQRAITLQGVTASEVLWNFTHTGTVFSTAGGNVLNGTFLATNPGQRFPFSLTGALINTVGHIQLLSNSRMSLDPFLVPQHGQVIPEPRSLLLFGTGLVAGAGVLRRKARVKSRHSAGKVLGVEPVEVRELTPSGGSRSE